MKIAMKRQDMDSLAIAVSNVRNYTDMIKFSELFGTSSSSSSSSSLSDGTANSLEAAELKRFYADSLPDAFENIKGVKKILGEE